MADKKNSAVIDNLSKLLADNYTLYLKTQNYHWNVTGPGFHGLHIMFEEQYKDLANAADEIAERIRALGVKAPASFSAFAKLATIQEETGSPDYKAMLATLVKDNETAAETCQALIEAAQAEGDEGSADLAIRRIQVHQKNHWMLKAYIE